MSARLLRPLLPVFVGAFVPAFGAGCPDGPAPVDGGGNDGTQCQTDLNYNGQTADGIAGDGSEEVTGFLCPARDADWYTFNVPSTGMVVKVHLWMDTGITNVEPGYSILTANEQPTGISGRHVDKSPGQAVDFEGLHRLENPGDYIVKVADVEGFDDGFDIANLYHLTVEVLPDPDGAEPNDLSTEATAITPGSATTGLIATTGDIDWYAIPVSDDAQVLDISVRAPEELGPSMVLEVYGKNAFDIVDRRTLIKASGETEYSTRTRVPASGTAGDHYYLKIFDETGAVAVADAAGSYEVLVTVLDDPDGNEANTRNDTPATARTVTSGQNLTGALATVGDQDLYRVEGPADATPENPKVLIVDLAFGGEVGAGVQPQLRVLTTNPEREVGELTPCPTGAGESCPDECITGTGGDYCGGTWLQRVMTQETAYRTAFPLRRNRPVYVAINDFGDDGWQESTTYTISFQIVDDPDPGEASDDYLIPNLQTAAYDNDQELNRQRNRSRERARVISDPDVVPSCPLPTDEPAGDAGVPDTCQPVVAVPAPVEGSGQVPYYVQCNGQTYTSTATGRLTYEGDRDWFRIDIPEAGYWGLDFDYSISSSTPVELTVFTYGDGDLINAFLEAQETGSGCLTAQDCPAGSNCIDGKCWADTDLNPAFSGHEFPTGDQCAFVHVNTARPLYVEITDNGINDFDVDMQYSVTVTARCGCPSTCGGGQYDACQGVAAP